MVCRSSWLKTGGRPFLLTLSASLETPTTRWSPSSRARSRIRRCPMWKTSYVPKVTTTRELVWWPVLMTGVCPTGRGA